MKNSIDSLTQRSKAFTLIELLVVIAVIAILAALLFPAMGSIKKKRMIAVAQSELAQVQTAIDAYKTKYGHYPPDNPGNPLINQLYYELMGTTNNGSGTYQTLDGNGLVSNVSATFSSVRGFVNTSTSLKGTDDKPAAISFLQNLKPNQVMPLPASMNSVRVLTCSVLLDPSYSVVTGDSTGMNPWRYISSNPTNNPNSYDLWVDLVISGKTNRISNWSSVPQTL